MIGASAGIWRFAGYLPEVDARHRVTLGEGSTPLIAAPRLAETIGIARLYLKLESQNPSGSFKDRGTAMAISEALAAGATNLVEDSSGNAGASAAAYAARTGLRCTIFAPTSAPPAKLQQAEAYGARVIAVSGRREDVADAARKAARDRSVYYLNHNSSDAFVAGTQTVAFELAQEFDSLPPIVLPVGGGSLLAGCHQGFGRKVADRTLSDMPPLFGVQSEACAPLVQALDNGWSKPVAVESGPTIAGGITIADPPRGSALLMAMRSSGGGAVAIGDEAIVRWGQLLARLEGVYAEPTSAAAVAGLARLVALGRIDSTGAAVVVITGSGLKDPDRSGDARQR